MAYGSITQRGDKYRVCFDYGVDREGKRVRKYQTFDTKRDATRAFNEHKVKMDKGTQIMPSEYTFAQWLDYWYKDIILPQIEETTAYGYRGMIENYLKPQLGEINPAAKADGTRYSAVLHLADGRKRAVTEYGHQAS